MTLKTMYRHVFYTQSSEHGPKKIWAIKHCKRPKATKVYKYMRRLFDSGEVAVYGYDYGIYAEIESNF